MKKNCDIIKDLLPLYVDEVCSNESKEMVDKHLEKCTECRAYKESLKSNIKEAKINEIHIIKSFAKNFKIIKSLVICLTIIMIGIFGVLIFCGKYEFTLKYDDNVDILLLGNDESWNFNIYRPIGGFVKSILIPYQENGENINIIFSTCKYSLYDKWNSVKYNMVGSPIDIDYSNINLDEKIEVYYTNIDLSTIQNSSLDKLKEYMDNSYLIFSNETRKSEINCRLNNEEYSYSLTYYTINKQVIASEGDNTMPEEILHNKYPNSSIVERYPDKTNNKVVWSMMDNIDDVFKKIENYMENNGGICTISD